MTGQLPNVTLDIIAAGQKVGEAPQRVLFVGQMIKNHVTPESAAGTFTPLADGSLVTNIPNDDDATRLLFGNRSMIATMLIAAREVNPITRFDAIVLADNPASAISTASIEFLDGPSTADGRVSFAIGSKLNHTITVEISKGETAFDITSFVVDAINTDTTLPAVATQDTVFVNLGAANSWKGASKIGIEIFELPPGININIVGFDAVGTDPLINLDTFKLIENERYQTIVWPETYLQGALDADSYKLLIEDLEVKFNAPKKVLDGVAIIAMSEASSPLINLLTLLDTPVLSIFANAPIVVVPGVISSAIFELNYVQSSFFGAIRALRLTKDADIARFVSATNGALDNFGGAHLASLPYFNTPFSLLPVVPQGHQFSPVELQNIINAQGSLLVNNDANTEIVALQVFTLSKTANTQNPNNSFEFLNFVDTISNVREYFFNNLKARYAQTRLTDGNLVRGVNIANANSIRAFMGGLYKDLAGPEFVLVQAGEAAATFFKDHLVVTIDLAERKATIDCQVPIVTQLANIIGVVQISFSTNN